jgi:hypothetical protein
MYTYTIMSIPDLPYEIVDIIISRMKQLELQDIMKEMLHFHKHNNREYHESQLVPIRRYGWCETFEWSRTASNPRKEGVVYTSYVEDLHETHLFSTVSGLRKNIKKHFPRHKRELKELGMPPLSNLSKNELIEALYKLC